MQVTDQNSTNLKCKRFIVMIEDHFAIVTSLRKHHLEKVLGTYSNVVTVIDKRFRPFFHYYL